MCVKQTTMNTGLNSSLSLYSVGPLDTVDSRYLEVEGTLWNTSRYPYFDISDVQNWGKYQSNNQISQMNRLFDSFC